MDFEKDDYNKLKKIGISSLLELCLCAPKSYEDRSLSTTLTPNQDGVFEVHIKEHFRAKNTLRIEAYLPAFHRQATLVIFYPKAFHTKIFTKGSVHFVQARVQIQASGLSLLQPKPLTQINTISLRFKRPLIKDSTLQEICARYITQENLTSLSIPPAHAKWLYEVFHPTQSLLSHIKQTKSLPKGALDALKYVEIFHHITSLSKKRLRFPSKFSPTTSPKSFIDSLPFALTPAQSETISTIKRDLASPTAARRIIIGDVGCGKTIVILSSVVMTYPYQSLLMVPTSVLAKQIYEEAKRLLPPHISIECITAANKPPAKASKTPKSAKKDQKNQEGQENQESTALESSPDSPPLGQNAHFIIGTQALLHRKLETKNLALVMTDEQHRFGTNQRHYLEKMAQEGKHKKPHFLQFSATPIPRSLSLINANLIDYSFIKDLPFKKDITTRIISKPHFPDLLTHIKSEIAKKHQCVIVYPLVEESEHLDYLSLEQGAPFWQKHFEKVFITFGGDKAKEETLEQFRDGGDILLATTLIEVGISLPRLSTIVIIAPERMGLATLHQLRGRVSRNGLKGYCFLYTHATDSKRLGEFASTLSGFDIAELDLKYRNGGNLLQGDRQSGESFRFFDMQNDGRLLEEAQEILSSLQ